MAPVARAPVGTPMPGVAKPQLLPLMQKSDALRKAMARKYTGSDEISETQLKQIQEQQTMNAIYDYLITKQKIREKMQQQGKVQYEYDSDEEIDPNAGTWEHQRRSMEMDATRFFPLHGPRHFRPASSTLSLRFMCLRARG